MSDTWTARLDGRSFDPLTCSEVGGYFVRGRFRLLSRHPATDVRPLRLHTRVPLTMGTEYSRPLPENLPYFPTDTVPPNLDFDNGVTASDVPVHLRREAPVPPASVAVPETLVPAYILYRLVPDLFPAPHILEVVNGALPTPPPTTPRPAAGPAAANSAARANDAPAASNPPVSAANLTAGAGNVSGALPPVAAAGPVGGNADSVFTPDLAPREGEASADIVDTSWSPPDSAPYPKVPLEIKDSALHRLLLHHAQLGFTFHTAPFAVETLLHANPLPLPNGINSDPEARAKALHRETALFEHAILSINIQALSALMSSQPVWAFTLALEPSPYFGHAGLEARACFYGPRGHHLSFHLLGIRYLAEDVPRLHTMLKALCPAVKLLGVVAQLQQRDHEGYLGVMVSSVIAYFAKHSPRKPVFLTPDSISAAGSAGTHKRPPLLPLELTTASTEELRKVVDEYRPKLDSFWSSDDINEIFRDHALLRHELGNWVKATGDLGVGDLYGGEEAKNSLAAFDKAWEFSAGRFRSLRNFVGALAAAYFYTPKKRTFFSLTGVDKNGNVCGASPMAADIILQEQQFEELRTYLATGI